MAATTVIYTLNMAGNLQQATPQLSANLQQLGATAQKVQAQVGGVAATTPKAAQGFAAIARALNQNQLISQMETVTSLFTQVGGSVSQMAIIATSAIRPVALVGTALGAAGIAALGLPVALAGVAFGFRAVANSALEARERLDKLGAKVTGSDKVALDAYAQATSDLAVSMDQLKVSVGADIAGALAIVVREVSAGVQLFGEARDATAEWRREIQAWVSLGWTEIIRATWSNSTGAADEISKAAGATREWVDALKKATIEAAKLNNEMEKEAQEDELRGRAEARRLEAEAARELAEAIRKAADYHKDLVRAAGTPGSALRPSFRGSYADKVADGTINTANAGEDNGWEPVKSAVDKATEGIEGVQSGVTGVLQMIPVYGQFLAAIWETLKHVGDIGVQMSTEIVDVITGARDQMMKAMLDSPMILIDALPEMLTAVILSGAQHILDQMASSPRIFAALVTAIIELPLAIVEGIGLMLKEFWRDLVDSIKELGSVLSNKDGQFLGTGLGAESEGHRRFLGIRIPAFSQGGTVSKSGLAFVDKGEDFTGVGRHRRQNSGPTNIAISMNGISSPDAFSRELEAKLGSYGIGLTLTPRTGG